MSFAFVTEFPIEGSDRSTTNYDAINDRLAHEQAPAGLVVHYAGFDEEAGVFRVVNIWDTARAGTGLPRQPDHAGRPRGARRRRAGAAADRASYELHHLLDP